MSALGPSRREIGEVVHRAERCNELSGEHREVTRARARLLDDQRVAPEDRCRS